MSAFTALHTLSHVLIKEFSAMSGFSLGSLAERLYLEVDDGGTKVVAQEFFVHIIPFFRWYFGDWFNKRADRAGKESDRTLVEGIVIMLNDPICMDHVPALVQKRCCLPCLCAPS